MKAVIKDIVAPLIESYDAKKKAGIYDFPQERFALETSKDVLKLAKKCKDMPLQVVEITPNKMGKDFDLIGVDTPLGRFDIRRKWLNITE